MGIFGSTSRDDLENYPDGLVRLLQDYNITSKTTDDRFGGKVILYSKRGSPQEMIAVHSGWSLSPEEGKDKSDRMNSIDHLEKTRLVHSRSMIEHPYIAQ